MALYKHSNHSAIPLVLNDRSQVEFQWTSLSIGDKVDFPKFSIGKLTSSECSVHHRPGYHCVKASIHLKRRWEYYAIRIYGPSLLLVATSFIGFWIPVLGYPARVTIVVTPLLSLITQQTQINSEINVNYIVSLHVWMMSCTFFVFMCLLELGLAVVYIHRVDERKSSVDFENSPSCPSLTSYLEREKKKDKEREKMKEKEREMNRTESHLSVKFDRERRRFSADIIKPDPGHWIKNLLNTVYGHVDWYKAPRDRNKVDYVARILFPSTFALFVLIYSLCLYQQLG